MGGSPRSGQKKKKITEKTHYLHCDIHAAAGSGDSTYLCCTYPVTYTLVGVCMHRR